MDNEILPEDRIAQARVYIKNKAKGLSKYQSAIQAGYSHNTARIPQVLEGRRSYAVALKEILDTNDRVLDKLISSIEGDVLNGTADELSLKERVLMTKTVADIHKILTPQVTIKEETMKDGSLKRTTWGSASYQVPQNGTGQEEEIQEEE